MSFLEREAHRRRIQQLMEFISTQLRPEMEKAVAQTEARITSVSRHYCPTDETSSLLPPEGDPGIQGATTTTTIPKTATRTATKTNGTAVGDSCGSTTPSGRNTPGLSDASIPDVSVKSAELWTVSEIGRSDPVTRQPPSIITIILRHVDSSNCLPQGILEGATADDLSVVDAYYETLSRMAYEIEKKTAAITRSASERFDRHMAENSIACCLKPRPRRRRSRSQDVWQTGGGRKTVWSADGDWGSEMAWSEVEVKPAAPVDKAPSSKLRHSYVPSVGSLASSGCTP